MSYRCLDCSYTRKGKFPGGKCPACDSWNISRPKTESFGIPKDKKTKMEIFILVLFWGFLIFGVWDRYFS
jgi:hypothetical protein